MKLAKDLNKRVIEECIDEYVRSWGTPDGMKDKETFEEIHWALSKNGFLNSKQLYEVARWKTPRVSKIVKKNPDGIVKSIIDFALKTSNEKYEIRILC